MNEEKQITRIRTLIAIIFWLASMCGSAQAPRGEAFKYDVKTNLLTLVHSGDTIERLANPTTTEILNGFDYTNYDPISEVPCPWQSWRILPYQSMQIDVLVDSIELRVLQSDNWIFADALESIWLQQPFDRIHLVRRGNRVMIRIPGQTTPYVIKYIRIDPEDALWPTPNPLFGWEYRITAGGMAIAVKVLGNGEYQVSSAIFMVRSQF